jgi:hypothetical protein
MNNEELKEYKKKLRLYEKILDLWPQVYGEQTAESLAPDGPGGGTNPPPPPPPKP